MVHSILKAWSAYSACIGPRNRERWSKKLDNFGGETEGFSFGHKLKRCEEEEVRESRVTTRRPRSRTGGNELRLLCEKGVTTSSQYYLRYTEIGWSLGMWFGEICSCPCLANQLSFTHPLNEKFGLHSMNHVKTCLGCWMAYHLLETQLRFK